MRRDIVVSGVLFFLLSLHYSIYAQGGRKKLYGIGLSYGFTNYLGDLDDNFTFRFTEFGVGAHVQYTLLDRLHLRGSIYHGYMEAADKDAQFTTNYKRNLSFRSNVTEVSVQGVIRFLKSPKGYPKRKLLNPYAFAGIAYFHFNPQAELNGVWYDLQPLGTEGQQLGGGYPEPYKLWQFSIPFGGGLFIRLSPSFDLAFELGLRKTFTDYLDDVSTNYPDLTKLRIEEGDAAYYLSYRGNRDGVVDSDISFHHRGNPGSVDWYAYTNLNLTYFFGIGAKKGVRGFFRDERQ
jgi:hypothetical protein